MYGQVCNTPAAFTFTNPCLGSATQFSGAGDGNPATWTWNFGDPASGGNNTASGQNPSHTFSSSASYNVTLTIPGPCGSVTQSVQINTPPVVNILHDTLVCPNSYTIDASSFTNANFLWSTGQTTSSLSIVDAGRYWLKVTQNGCTGVDTAKINIWGQGNVGNYNWAFGNKGSFNFKSNPPIPINGINISTNGGSSIISSPTGNLLLYTDGSNVYDRNNNIMTNGTGLLGNTSGYESSVIIPDPRDNNIYYIVTTSPTNGLNYSIADLSYNGGAGEIIQKNIPLSTPVLNGVASTYDGQNGFWAVAQQAGSSNIMSYHITMGGFNTTPVISSVGSAATGNNGYVQFSSDGTKLAISYASQNLVEVYNFDKNTGIISNPVAITNVKNPYSVAFSAGNNYLYVSTDTLHRLLQYNLGAGTQAKIDSSKYVLSKDSTINYDALAMNPDGQIDVALGNSGYLGVINSPDGDTSNADYIHKAITLTGAQSNTGLPNILTNYFGKPDWAVGISGNCIGGTTNFIAVAPDVVKSWFWDFGEPSSGAANNSTSSVATHVYANPGTYVVSVRAIYLCGDTTMTNAITISSYPVVNLGGNITVCSDTVYTLNAGNPNMAYSWSTGETTQQISVKQNGKYYVNVSNNGCVTPDTANVTFYHISPVYIGKDTTLCSGQSVSYNVGTIKAGSTVTWNNGSHKDTILVNSTGKYYATVSYNGCNVSDTVLVKVNPATTPINFGPDEIICTGITKTLNAGNPGLSYLWSTGATTQQIQVVSNQVSSNNTFWVRAYIGQCSVSDTIELSFVSGPNVSLPNEVTYCPDEINYANLYAGPAVSYLWSPTNETTDSIHVQAGNYSLTATDARGCKTTVSTNVYTYCQPYLYVPSAFSPNGDGINELFVIHGENIDQYEIDIFDKWGELIYVSHSMKDSWDGMYKGRLAQEDVYSWRIIYYAQGKSSLTKYTQEGNVTLLK